MTALLEVEKRSGLETKQVGRILESGRAWI